MPFRDTIATGDQVEFAQTAKISSQYHVSGVTLIPALCSRQLQRRESWKTTAEDWTMCSPVRISVNTFGIILAFEKVRVPSLGYVGI